MEKSNTYPFENASRIASRFSVKGEAVLNMAGVILFYVVVFVAFSVFSS